MLWCTHYREFYAFHNMNICLTDAPLVRRNGPSNVERQRSKTGTHLLPKVTVIYAHNPDYYIQIAPPIMESEETQAQYTSKVLHNEQYREQNITHQKELVKKFVHFLKLLGIAAAYDQLIDDCPVDNKRKWIEGQVKDSDYVIFIVTPSFEALIEAEDTPVEEMIFQGPYLHNLMSNPGHNVNGGKIVLVSVFLDRSKLSVCIPKTLETGNTFELWAPFVREEGRGDDLLLFCSFIMGEKSD